MNNTYILFIIYLIFTLILPITSLSLSNSKQYDAAAYQSALLNEQQLFQSQVNQVQSQIQSIRQMLSNTTITKQLVVSQLTQGLADQRNSLYQMQQILKLPFNLRQCQCTILTPQLQSQINQQLTNLSTKISALRSSLQLCNFTTCPRYQQLSLELSQSQNYLNIMNETLNSQCCKSNFNFLPQNATGLVDLQGTIYKDNLNAPNWFYGSISQKDYTLQRFEYSTKYNITSCPLTIPFANFTSNICFNCPYLNQYFNLGSRSCVSCDQPNTFLNLTTGSCDSCPNNTFYNIQNQTCIFCNLSAGFFFNTTTYICQPCPAGQYFSTLVQTCINCQGNSYFNPNISQCVVCPPLTYWSPATASCQSCSPGSIFNTQTQSCITCPSGSIFNPQTQACITCPSGSSYNTTTNMCQIETSGGGTIICPIDSPFYNSFNNMCQKCDYYQVFDATTNTCKQNNTISICPPDRPFFNSNTFNCISCPTGSQYDPNNKVCISLTCKPNQFLNPFTNQCTNSAGICGQGLYYNPASQTCMSGNNSFCQYGQIYDVTSGNCVSLSSTCSLDQYYDSSTGKCFPKSQTCSSNEYYNTTQHACKSNSARCPVDYTYVESSGQCISSASYCTDTQFYSPMSHSCLPGSSLCHTSQYFNKPSNSCLPISTLCSQNGTVYDLESGSCLPNCPSGYFYNRTNSLCQLVQNSTQQQCIFDQTYLPDINLCVKTSTTCTNMQWYNPTTFQCQSPTYITSPYAPNLIMQTQPFTSYQTYYTSQVSLYSAQPNSLRDCPTLTPYYDPTNKVCISCSTDSPLFNLETYQCAKCNTGFIFNPSNHQCILNNS